MDTACVSSRSTVRCRKWSPYLCACVCAALIISFIFASGIRTKAQSVAARVFQRELDHLACGADGVIYESSRASFTLKEI